MYLEFKCGVQIQLGFAAEFSNVMIIYTRIVKQPPEIVVCRAYVTDFALVSASSCCLSDLPPLVCPCQTASFLPCKRTWMWILKRPTEELLRKLEAI